MNILFISHLYHPHIGGVEKHIQFLSKELLKDHHKITVITSLHDPSLKAHEIIDGIEVFRISVPKIKILGLLDIWCLLIKLRKLINIADIIHIHDVFIWVLPLRLIHFKKQFYLTHHGWEGEYPIPFNKILIKKLSNALSTKSMAVGHYIEKYYGIKTNSITYGAVNHQKVSQKKPNTILYLGRLSTDTGLTILLEAFPKLKNFSISFCGSGELESKCKKIGKVATTVNPNLLLKSTQFCIVSGYLSLLEAISWNCIPVAIYVNSLKKDYFKMSPFIKDIILVKSADELVDAIKKAHQSSFPGPKFNEYSWFNLKMEYYNLWRQER